MRKVLSILAISLLFFSCGKTVKYNNSIENNVETSSEYDNVEQLRGKTFTNYNRDYEILLKESFYFTSTGSVHFIEKVEGFPAETKYNNFHYKLCGDKIEIYYVRKLRVCWDSEKQK